MYQYSENESGNRAEQSKYERIAKGLGWFSIGLGAAEIAAPGMIANLIGIRDNNRNRMMLRSPLYGLREVAAGVGILTQPKPVGWLWSRVAGDLMDLSSLGVALSSRENDRAKVTTAICAVAGVTILDFICAKQLSQSQSDASSGGDSGSSRTTRAITVNKGVEEVYGFWSNFENFPSFMHHLESVQTSEGGRSRWRATGPMGKTVEWEAQTEQQQPNRLIAWRSVEGSDVHNSGTVFFEPGPSGKGTVVRVDLSYDPPGGVIGAAVAKLFGKDAGQMLDDDLRAFKQIMETGEVVRSDASVHSHMHAARPSDKIKTFQGELVQP